MRSALITGAAGFVSQSLLPDLVEIGFDKLYLVDRRAIPPSLTSRLRQYAVVHEFVSDRIPDSADVACADIAICLAGTTSVDAALHDPAPAMLGNTALAIDLAEWSSRTNPDRRVVYMSSDEVLGPSSNPLPEDAPLKPSQPYAASKAAAEFILHNYRDVYGLNLVTVRSCNLVGPYQRKPKLLPVSVAAMLAGQPVPIHGSGEQRREWMDVSDLARAIVTVADSAVAPGVYQAASGVHYGVSEVVAMVASALDQPFSTTHVADRRVQDFDYAMSACRLQACGWSITVAPDEAIARAARSLQAEHP